MGLYIDTQESVEKHQQLIRTRMHKIEMHDAFELIQDHATVEDVAMFEQAISSGSYADAGYIFMRMLTYAATQDTESELYEWEEETANERAGQWRTNARRTREAGGVYLPIRGL